MAWIASKKYSIIFIHIPKTGGSSIACPPQGKGLLLPYLGERDICPGGHIKAINLYSEFKNVWDEYFKFAFVRNPWDRMISLFFYFKSFGKKGTPLGKEIAKFKSFKEFCRNLNQLQLDMHFEPQINWITDSDGKIIIDFIGKYERFSEDLSLVLAKTNIDGKKLPHLRKTVHLSYEHYYDEETKDIIYNKYEKDVETFGYSFQKPDIVKK